MLSIGNTTIIRGNDSIILTNPNGSLVNFGAKIFAKKLLTNSEAPQELENVLYFLFSMDRFETTILRIAVVKEIIERGAKHMEDVSAVIALTIENSILAFSQNILNGVPPSVYFLTDKDGSGCCVFNTYSTFAVAEISVMGDLLDTKLANYYRTLINHYSDVSWELI